MTTILVISDNGVPTGYGRIADEVCMRLHKRGYTVFAASIMYDGLLPPQLNGTALPYWVSSLAGHNWVEESVKLISVIQPDAVMVIQDAPYIEAMRNAPVDWSRYALIAVTPVDGVPIYPRWVDVLKKADACLSISQFGVDAYKTAGVPMTLLRPGVDVNRFFRRTDEERFVLRQKLGLDQTHYIVGSAAMNQGRKAISMMLKAFFRFASDKQHARYLLDMEAVSPAGWDIPALCQQWDWDESKLIYRADAERAGLHDLSERYNLLNCHMVISHREGYGLPLAEAMACGVVSMALDYCSGPEIVGENRGVLIPAIDYEEPGTWGGACDKFPDIDVLVEKLEWLYTNNAERAAMGQRGMAWSREQTWDKAADAVQSAVDKALQSRKLKLIPATVPIAPVVSPQTAAKQQAPDGVKVDVGVPA